MAKTKSAPAQQAAAASLDGLKIVDLTRVLGGPYATQILADHGADVIKLEPPQGDEVRDWGPPFHDGDASYFIGVNRNKRSVGLDLGQPQGRAVLLSLLKGADVLIENFKPGSMEAWGLGWEQVLKERFPRLIYCKISGFGADGPLGGYPGYDAIVGAMTGMFTVNGEPASGPTRLGIAIVDMGTGLYCAAGILMALYERARSGEGQYLDMTLYDCALSLMHPHFANFHLSGQVPGLTGNAHTNLSPYDKFKTKTCDIFLGAGNERAFKKVCEELGAPELADDPRFASNATRVAHRAELRRELEDRLAKVDGEAFSTRLLKAGLPCGPILDSKQVLESAHTKHREMVVEKDWYKGTATPIKMSRTPGSVRSAPPRFSEHARQIMQEAGFSTAEIDKLAATGVVCETRRK